jgi:hypothetical protein
MPGNIGKGIEGLIEDIRATIHYVLPAALLSGNPFYSRQNGSPIKAFGDDGLLGKRMKILLWDH